MAEQELIEAAGPTHLGRHQLRTLNQVAEEIARVYRAFARGSIAKDQANSAVYQLTALSKVLEVVRIEDRLDALEGGES